MNDPLTLVAEIARLRSLGYDADMSVTPEGNVRCSPCGHVVEPSRAAVETTARFEGASNPDDQSIVFGIHCLGCGTRGVLVAAYGPSASAAEAAVLIDLRPPTGPSGGDAPAQQ